MSSKRNYQKELDKKIRELQSAGRVPSLLLHSCCAPCSSYVLEYLSKYFDITVFYYNPNITDGEEYRRRVSEQQRLIAEMDTVRPVSFFEGRYEPEVFFETVKGLENIPEGGERCRRCFELRLAETAHMAAGRGDECFTTTLTISPLKNAEVINEVGELAAQGIGCASFLPCDFKKRDGYKRSLELSRIYGLYRQDYCGCIFSKLEREKHFE